MSSISRAMVSNGTIIAFSALVWSMTPRALFWSFQNSGALAWASSCSTLRRLVSTSKKPPQLG